MFHRSRTGHPKESSLLHAMRCSPLDPRTWLLRRHLAHCAQCRDRCKKEESELFVLFAPYERAADLWISDDSASRQRLLSNMRSELAAPSRATLGRLSASRPGVLAAGLVAACATLIYIASVPPRPAAMTAGEVLTIAAALDNAQGPKSRPGVIFHRVEITAGSHRFEWSWYRDQQGKRKPRVQPIRVQEVELGQRLADSGISNDDPLSASSYRIWRNHLGSFNDNIVHSPSGLFIITTSVPANSPTHIKAETLTLRGDYHPIRRTVVFQDSEEIQVAELDYRMLSWDEVHPGLFDDSSAVAPIPAPMLAPHEEGVAPELSDSELTLTELQVRLALSQGNLDVNEHVEMFRRPEGIDVRGFVSSPEKKKEIHSAIEHVPHVLEELASPSDTETSAAITTTPQSHRITVVQSVSNPSPLFIYWKSQNRNPDELPSITANMLDAALRINQQSRALRDLVREFDSGSKMDVRSREVFRSLLRDHTEKLRTALSNQQESLKTLQVAPSVNAPVLDPGTISQNDAAIEELDQRATRSMSLSRELNTGDESGQLHTEPLLVELNREASTMAALLDRISSLNR